MIRFEKPLIKGTLIQRYKRFLADVTLENGEQITAHCANSGSMWGIRDPGMTVYVQPTSNPARKLQYTLELVEADGGLVGCNTGHPNTLVQYLLQHRQIPELAAYETVRREVKYGTQNSRIDFFLSQPGLPDAYVEVKNVHMMRTPALAEFPDAVTSRGARHLEELIGVKSQGHRAVMLYLVQRMDCSRFTIARDIDKIYGEMFEKARLAGVEMLCYNANITLHDIGPGRPIEII